MGLGKLNRRALPGCAVDNRLRLEGIAAARWRSTTTAPRSTVALTTGGDGAGPGPLNIIANERILTQVPVGGANFSVTAAGTTTTYSSWPVAVWSYSLNPTSATFSSGGGAASVGVNTQAGCACDVVQVLSSVSV